MSLSSFYFLKINAKKLKFFFKEYLQLKNSLIMNTGIIYFIQPTELIGTNRYKIGCSENTELDRVKKGYKKGTRYIFIIECNNPFVL